MLFTCPGGYIRPCDDTYILHTYSQIYTYYISKYVYETVFGIQQHVVSYQSDLRFPSPYPWPSVSRVAVPSLLCLGESGQPGKHEKCPT